MNNRKHNKNRALFAKLGAWTLAGSLVLIGYARLTAQTVNQYETGDDDEIVVLEEFSVNASNNPNEYVASEALSGTRTGASILEIPFNVQVMTSEFMEDFQVMNEYNEFPTVANYSPGDGNDEKINTNDGGTQRLRGFTPKTMRDGFSRAGPANIANTKQVEAIMGPQSALYGQASPGGILNYISKRPRRQKWNRLTLAAGNYDYRRAEVEFNSPVVRNKLYYMFNASYSFREGESDFAEIDSRSYLLGVTYLIAKQTSLSINMEQQFVKSIQGAGMPQWVVGSTPSSSNPSATGGYNVGPYTKLKDFNRLGPYQDKHSRFDNVTALLEHRFNQIFSARLNTLYYHRKWDDKTWSSGLQLDEATMRMRLRYPMKRLQTIDNYGVQADFLSQFKTGSLDHKLLVAADFVRDKYDNKQWLLPQTGDYAPEKVLGLDTRYLNPFNPVWETVNYDWLTRVSTSLKRIYDHAGVAASFRTQALNQKLLTSMSVRYSHTDSDIQNRATPSQSGKGTEDGTIYSIGANYKLKGNAAVVYANTSTSYEPSTTYDRGLGKPIKAERGKGFETGMKGSLLDQKLNYTLSLYYIEKRNVRETNEEFISEATTPGVPQYLTSGKVRVRGGEIAANIVPRKNITIIATFGYTDAEITEDAGKYPSTVGKRPLYVPKYTASLLTSYGFSGLLKGLRVRLSGNITGDKISQHDDFKTTNPSKREYITPSLFLMSTGASYEIKTGGRIKHTIAFDIQNLLNKEYYYAGNYTPGRGRSYSMTYRFNF